MLSMVVPALWIIFDVMICLRTGYMSGPFQRWEWWTWLLSGVALAGLAFYPQSRESKRHEKQMAEILAGQATHSRDHEVLAGGILTNLDRLAAVTSTTGQAPTVVIEAANTKISVLESKIARYDQMFWSPLEPDEKSRLAVALAGLGSGLVGKLSVSITAHENTDCRELASDLKECFERAGWSVARVPLSGTWTSSGASGFFLRQKVRVGAFNKIVFDALQTAVRGPISGMLNEDQGGPDVGIVVGTKKLRND